MTLPFGTGVFGHSVVIEPAFVADADAVGVAASGMRTGTFQRPERLYITVLTDVKMITCAGEAPAQVVCCQVVFRIAAVAAGGGTVDNDEVDESHFEL